MPGEDIIGLCGVGVGAMGQVRECRRWIMVSVVVRVQRRSGVMGKIGVGV